MFHLHTKRKSSINVYIINEECYRRYLFTLYLKHIYVSVMLLVNSQITYKIGRIIFFFG